MKIKIYFVFLFCVITINGFTQDTVKIMAYNLLGYNSYTSYCTTLNNQTDLKDGYLRTIFSYERPDIFGVNEVSGAGVTSSKRILDSVINVNGITWYKRANYINTNLSPLISTIYYDSRKFFLYNQNYISTSYRDIMIYKFYYNSPDLINLNDTVFLTCIVMHLKAGSSASDQSERAAETLALMNYLNQLGADNYLVMGDFNVQSHTETCFQNLINYSNANIRFYDPINKLGNWNNNSFYALYHTQSTSTDANNTCKASGGLDDRFDFILSSFYIMNNISKISYLPNSYRAVGQDGNRFNQTIISPANYSVPTNVVSALSNMSDHLPVVLKLKISQTPVFGVNEIKREQPSIIFENPIGDNTEIQLFSENNEMCTLTVYDQQGRLISKFSYFLHTGYNVINFQSNDLNSGMYFFNFVHSRGSSTIKIFKK